jgi:hypothetical protein
MNPLYIAGAALLAYFAATAGSASASTEATQGQMVFKDYCWQMILPSTTTNVVAPGTGSMSPQEVPLLPPPPGAQAGSGHWFEMPQGMQLSSPVNNAQTGQVMTPGTSLNPILQPLPPIAVGLSYFVWKPNKGVLANFGGYLVTTGNWHFSYANQTNGTMNGFYPYGHGPAITWATPIARPPGAPSGSGKWHQALPGYYVWLTPTNANTGELAQQIFALPAPVSYPATMSTTPATAINPATGVPYGATAATPGTFGSANPGVSNIDPTTGLPYTTTSTAGASFGAPLGQPGYFGAGPTAFAHFPHWMN